MMFVFNVPGLWFLQMFDGGTIQMPQCCFQCSGALITECVCMVCVVCVVCIGDSFRWKEAVLQGWGP